MTAGTFLIHSATGEIAPIIELAVPEGQRALSSSTQPPEYEMISVIKAAL